MAVDRIVAVGFLTEGDVRALGDRFLRLFPVEHDDAFDELIAKLDQIPASADQHDRSLAIQAAVERAALKRD